MADFCKKYAKSVRLVKEPTGFLNKSNMLFTEWNRDDALVVRFEEGGEEIARNALAKGLPPDIIREITGLDIETIRNIAR